MIETPPPDPGFALRIDPFGHLIYRDVAGRDYPDAVPVRAYPITDPGHWVIICDAEGRELRCIEDLSALPAALRTILEDELARREFVPHIRRVILVSSYLEPAEWEVETDRGPTRFVLKTEDDVRRLGPYSALLQDSQGIRYLVPDTRNLDPYSRRAVDRYL
ncbi:DUF1854 domain-containing protein [uncultured Thiodictyon sp.]|jgi:hypothetical protein|uniref:cyanophycin metabolism-associated DUF1854 family protein n=1 Tax=uncultured Thiodictyon sp. TaxID=1846217 RepID=UPI0025DBFF44|nr:DUF1854 domain-containing protein [uncultured Thiodictyon sp.]